MLARLALVLVALTAVACVGDDRIDTTSEVAARTPGGGGNLSLEWSIRDGDALQDCVAVGADSVEVVASAGSREIVQALPCLDGVADTGDVPGGDYDVAIRLVDLDGAVIDHVDLGSVSIVDGYTTPLGAIEFAVAN